MLTDDELKVIKAREQAATKEPWIGERRMVERFMDFTADDFEFILHARSDIPKLLKEVERLLGTNLPRVEVSAERLLEYAHMAWGERHVEHCAGPIAVEAFEADGQRRVRLSCAVCRTHFEAVTLP